MHSDFLKPEVAVEMHYFVEIFFGEIFHSAPVEMFVFRLPAEWNFDAFRSTAGAFDNPFQNTHIFTVSRPEEFTVFAFQEPVDRENAGRFGDTAADIEPVREIIP